MLEQDNIITLSNNQDYIVVYKTELDNQEFCYIMNMNDDEDSMICKVLPNKDIDIINDQKIVERFLTSFVKDTINKQN